MRLRKNEIYSISTYNLLIAIQSLTLTAINSRTYHIPILKNGHNWMHQTFAGLNITVTDPSPQYLVLLRDPVQRWTTGFNTYCRRWNLFRNQYIQHSHGQAIDQQQLWLDLDHITQHTLILDAHTVPQWAYIHDYPKHRINFVEFNDNISKFIHSCYGVTPKAMYNSTQGNAYAEFLHSQITQYVIDRDLLRQLHSIYEKDYELIEGVDLLNTK